MANNLGEPMLSKEMEDRLKANIAAARNREETVCLRAEALLNGNAGITQHYAETIIDAGIVDSEDLRGHKNGRGRIRWYLA